MRFALVTRIEILKGALVFEVSRYSFLALRTVYAFVESRRVLRDGEIVRMCFMCPIAFRDSDSVLYLGKHTTILFTSPVTPRFDNDFAQGRRGHADDLKHRFANARIPFRRLFQCNVFSCVYETSAHRTNASIGMSYEIHLFCHLQRVSMNQKYSR